MLRRKKPPAHRDDQATWALRRQMLQADPATLGIERSDRFPNVLGVAMDMAVENGVATLVVLADGTTSLYTTSGFGIIGAGGHAHVVRRGRALLRAAEEHLAAFDTDEPDEPPPPGMVTIRLLTHDGRLSVTKDENTLGHNRSTLSPVFHAAHAVIAELRLLDESLSS